MSIVEQSAIKELKEKLYANKNALMEAFQEQDFTPLPYRLFDSHNVLEAFRLMQQSGHIGKILVKAPSSDQASIDVARANYMASSDGTHIIVGGLGGFGLETARWLADMGARSIVLTSRTGKASDEAQKLFASLQDNGVSVEVACCDVTDEESLMGRTERGFRSAARHWPGRCRSAVRPLAHVAPCAAP